MIHNHSTIRKEGNRVLSLELGAANTANFLRQLENGSGNYTEERHEWLEKNTVDMIAARIEKRKQQADHL
jgi:hypothetical protein